ncbi:acylneuraminate cytidylyltransferase family protein [Paenibacillus kyungheensis]|uniref:Acylneuraminate cytidylyltransferase family protein n=1 Tax=Paenibacillus kyungheensis TaxID=1452732 RepID=A0AAX3LZW8_9BACL|nr:acylneuraminate cytidylyltransferase family protein [Paenibacillus kyungheensis]WCT55362.1 acylneuraminate cytidylyltransferase family protein [Paenibacillus kyungheensis]
MSSSTGCLAIIPARGGSKGLPDKNIRLLNHKPLIQYSIEAALKSTCITEVIVTTDSPRIAEVARDAGATVPFLRPEELSTDEAKSIDVLEHAVDFCEQQLKQYYPYIMLLQPTSPLRQVQDIEQAFATFLQYEADSLQSVTLSSSHPYLLRELQDEQLVPYLKHQDSHLRRQDLQDVYALNGAIYIMKRDLLCIDHSLVGARNYGYIMPEERSIDIDTDFDLKLAQFMLTTNDRSN